jgi:hypothetical protein
MKKLIYVILVLFVLWGCKDVLDPNSSNVVISGDTDGVVIDGDVVTPDDGPTPLASLTKTWGSQTSGATQISVDNLGRVWIADTGNDRALGFSSTGTLLYTYTGINVSNRGSGTTTQALQNPIGADFSPDGFLYISVHVPGSVSNVFKVDPVTNTYWYRMGAHVGDITDYSTNEPWYFRVRNETPHPVNYDPDETKLGEDRVMCYSNIYQRVADFGTINTSGWSGTAWITTGVLAGMDSTHDRNEIVILSQTDKSIKDLYNQSRVVTLYDLQELSAIALDANNDMYVLDKVAGEIRVYGSIIGELDGALKHVWVYGNDLNNPVYIEVSPLDGSLFVLEQDGTINKMKVNYTF